MKTKREESKFMKWGLNNEATISHFVAWTLKCATKEGENTYCSKLSGYSKKILLYLLFGKDGLDHSDRLFYMPIKWSWIQQMPTMARVVIEVKNT